MARHGQWVAVMLTEWSDQQRANDRRVFFEEGVSIEGIGHLRQPGVEAQKRRELKGGLHFIAGRARRPLEFEAAVVRDIDLLVRAIDQEEVRADAEPREPLRDARLMKVGRRDARPAGALHDAARRARALASIYEDMREMIRIGAYKDGANAQVDEAIAFHERLETFLAQARDEKVDAGASEMALRSILPQDETEEA